MHTKQGKTRIQVSKESQCNSLNVCVGVQDIDANSSSVGPVMSQSASVGEGGWGAVISLVNFGRR